MGTEKCQKRVLVVEDNELNRKIAAQVIEDERSWKVRYQCCTDSCHDGIHISGRLEAGRTVGNERIYCEAAGYGRFI